MDKKYIKKKLEEAPFFRERANKDLGLAKLILMEHPELAITALTPEKLAHILQMYNSADRLWRLILQENESLRGSDWEDGKRLSQEKQVELGYEPLTKLKV